MQAKKSLWPTLVGLLALSVARAGELPPVHELKERMPIPSAMVAVYEPHATGTPGTDETLIEYVGYPANDVMALLFGSEWHGEGDTIELKALDGYIARIEVARFLKETAFLVFARADGAPFTVDNLRQNTTDVPLGAVLLGMGQRLEPGPHHRRRDPLAVPSARDQPGVPFRTSTRARGA